MTTDETLELAHREAWRYKKSSDPHHSDTYTFNRSTLLEFARKLVAIEREACAKVCDADADNMEQEAQRAIENDEHDEVSAIRSTAWKLSVAAGRIRARSKGLALAVLLKGNENANLEMGAAGD